MFPLAVTKLKGLHSQPCTKNPARIDINAGVARGRAAALGGLTEVLVYDERLRGDRPIAGNTPVIEVDSQTPLTILVAYLVSSVQDKWLKHLKIHCHGYPGGLQICRENLNIHNVNALAPLFGRFTNAGMIELYACEVAAGNGIAFCKALARTCRAWVKASSAVQTYRMNRRWPGPLDFGDWEGNVHVFDPRGNQIS